MINKHAMQYLPRRAVVFCGICLLHGSVAARADESEILTQRFFQEAPHAWEDYGSYVERLQGTRERTITIDGKVRSITRIEYKSNPRCKLVLTQSLNTEDSLGEIFAFNPRYGFNLKRKTNDVPWMLADLQIGTSRVGPMGWERFPALRLCIDAQPYELPELIRLPEFRIVRAALIQHSGLELCQITFDSKETDGFLVLDPNRFWTIHQSKLRTTNSNAIIISRQEIELRDRGAKYPVPKHRLLNKEFANGPKPGKSEAKVEEELDVKELSMLPDDNQFTLSAFGLPEPMGMQAPSRSHAYLWIASAAVGAAAIAMLFRWLTLRSRKV